MDKIWTPQEITGSFVPTEEDYRAWRKAVLSVKLPRKLKKRLKGRKTK